MLVREQQEEKMLSNQHDPPSLPPSLPPSFPPSFPPSSPSIPPTRAVVNLPACRAPHSHESCLYLPRSAAEEGGGREGGKGEEGREEKEGWERRCDQGMARQWTFGLLPLRRKEEDVEGGRGEGREGGSVEEEEDEVGLSSGLVARGGVGRVGPGEGPREGAWRTMRSSASSRGEELSGEEGEEGGRGGAPEEAKEGKGGRCLCRGER